MNAHQRRKARRKQERERKRKQLLQRVLNTALDILAREYPSLFVTETEAVISSTWKDC